MRSSLVFALVVAAVPSVVYSQDGSGFLSEVAVANTNTAVTSAMQNIAMQETVKGKSRTLGAPVSNRQISNAAPNLAFLTFSASPARTRANLQAIVDRSRLINPSGAAKLQQFFSSTDVLARIGSGMSSLGLSRYNVADVYAAFWIAAWQGANGISVGPSRQAVQAVANQTRRALAGPMAGYSDSQKQELAENLLIQGAMIESMANSARGNPAKFRSVSMQIRQTARTRGLNLDAMELTPQGFVPVGARR